MITKDDTAKTKPGAGLERRIAELGRKLTDTFTPVLDAIPSGPFGPVELARVLGIDKVLASRVVKAARHRDPIAVVHTMPGPEPLRRFLRCASAKRVDPALIAAAGESVNAFELLIRRDAGDRSALDAIISAWLPEAKREFELRRKQAAFRAMSQLKGSAADISLATVILHPSDDGNSLDVVWVFGLFGLQRLRPGIAVKFNSRRVSGRGSPRRPKTLSGESVEGFNGLRLDEFCSNEATHLVAAQSGDVVHYTLPENGFGPRSATDLVFAEANYAEMPRYLPADSDRRGYVFAEVATPVKLLVFDVLADTAVYPRSDATLAIYDTVLNGIADINDPARDIDRLDMSESIQSLDTGLARLRTTEVPRYSDLLKHVFGKLGWDADHFRGYRCRIDYPLYGSQIAMAFDPPAPPDS